MNPRQINIVQLFRLFNVDLPAKLQNCRSVEEEIQRFNGAKDEALANYKKLAFAVHPDRNNGDDQKIKELNSARDLLMDLQAVPRPRPVIRRSVVFHGGFGGFSSNTSTASTSTTGSFYGSVYWNTWNTV